ncbi:photosynthetic complex putative assembly protein PuhB [Erythrobacter sp. NE805]|uniref:photosynthetic complex putative assembly protein PuhB n=1 Tax=Erythrobacter sp. NE805 TaxID=3389875 RepID=UPI00396B256C
MALNDPAAGSGPAAGAAAPVAAGRDHSALENDGPRAFGDRMGTPQPDEAVLWKGRPQVGLLARTAFHTRTLGLYMAALAGVAVVLGRTDAALVAAGLGIALTALLYGLAWMSARTTLYILTDTRLIMRIGMAIETRVNIPLKQVTAAHLRLRGKGHGDIAFELSGERMLGNLLLWPHVRPWHYAMPQPMLRAVPDAAALAQMIAEARARFGAIDRNLSEIKEAAPAGGQTLGQPAAATGRRAPVLRGEPGLEGAPA